MAERVVEGPLAARWEPNAPDAVLMSTDGGFSALALEPHPNDADRRCIVLIWKGTKLGKMSDPNYEAGEGHRSWSRGLASIYWAALVGESEFVAELEMANQVHPRHDPAKFHRLSRAPKLGVPPAAVPHPAMARAPSEIAARQVELITP